MEKENEDLIIREDYVQNDGEIIKETASAVEKFAEKAVTDLQQKAISDATSKDYKESIKEIANIAMTVKAFDADNPDNDQFLDEAKKAKQQELLQEFISDQLRAEARKYIAKQAKAEAFYTNFRPILEFDFSHLIPKTKKNTLFTRKPKRDKRGNMAQNQDDTESTETTQVATQQITYKDRSYGIPLMILMLCIFTLPYVMVSIALALANGVNAIFDGISRFGKPALLICGSIVGILIMILAVYCVMLGIDGLFGTSIINTLK